MARSSLIDRRPIQHAVPDDRQGEQRELVGVAEPARVRDGRRK
jgi:hypothetical protein